MKHKKITSSITSKGVISIRAEDIQKQTSFTELENDISSSLVPVSSKTPDYIELKKRIKRKGLLEKQPTYYACKILFTLGMLGLSLIFLTVLDNFYLQLVSAICLAFVQMLTEERNKSSANAAHLYRSSDWRKPHDSKRQT